MSNSSRSYADSLKSTSIIGSAQVVTMLVGLVRIKLVAVLIGPTGVGLVNLLLSITTMTSTLAGLGIQNSGVRDVAEAVGSGDRDRIGRTILTLRRMCWLTGICGCLFLVALASFISQKTFGSSEHVNAIRLLGITILLGNIATGQAAIIQGTRRIGDLARISVVGAVAATIIAGIFYGLWGMEGIVPALLAISAVSLAVSTWFARKIPVPQVEMTWRASFNLAAGLVSLGLAFVWSGLLVTIITYLTNLIITHEFGLFSVGVFAAAFSLSGLFVQFVLQAMGADYYPRLTASANDHSLMNKLINEQTEVGLLMAFPGLLATLALAPLAIRLFYSPEFAPAALLLKWFVFGCMGKVVSFPLGFVMLAKGKGVLFAGTQTLLGIVHIGLILACIRVVGLPGVAIAFALLYIFASAIVFIVAKHLTGFTWEAEVISMFKWMIPMAVIVFVISLYAGQVPASAIGSIAAIISAIICLRLLAIRVGPAHRICRTIHSLPAGSWLLPHSLFSS